MENALVFYSFKLSFITVFIIVIIFSKINIFHYYLQEVNLYYHNNMLPLSKFCE